jgi:hypothetical protein
MHFVYACWDVIRAYAYIHTQTYMNECLRKCLSCVSVHPYKCRYDCVHVPVHVATRACVFMRTCMNIGSLVLGTRHLVALSLVLVLGTR